MPALVVTPSVTLPAEALSWSASRSSGPGGQNVNKVASKVDLRLDLTLCDALDGATKARLRTLAGGRLDADGRVIVTSERTRDQRRNLDDARDKLAALVRRALHRDPPRRPTRPSRGAVARRLDGKRKTGDKKRARRGPDE